MRYVALPVLWATLAATARTMGSNLHAAVGDVCIEKDRGQPEGRIATAWIVHWAAGIPK
jgi:hypothetical protein